MTKERIRELSLVRRVEPEPSGAVERARFDAPPPSARPSERLEPWTLSEDRRARALGVAAAKLDVPFQLAAAVVVERSLLRDDFAALGLNHMLDRLDEEAAQAIVAIELSEALSAYLRALAGCARQPSRAHAHLAALPMRLIERIGSVGPVPHLDETLLESALLWERAAVRAGRTMSEWATLKALELLRSC
jgi:hypothetical protein